MVSAAVAHQIGQRYLGRDTNQERG
jgi:hypothetical protein